MLIQKFSFIKSSTNHEQCPLGTKPEIAFIGRSNVGKSSLINMLVNKKKLAQVSSTPGKTQLINHFLINESYYLVDLPGYGWAKLSQDKKKDLQKMILNYLLYRKNLVEVFLLIDIRLVPQKIDLEFMEWLCEAKNSFSIVFTKADKLSEQKVLYQVNNFQQILKEKFGVVNFFVTSSKIHTGRVDLMNYIGTLSCSPGSSSVN